MTFKPAWAGQVCSLGYVIGPEIESDLAITLTVEQANRLIEYYRVDPVTGARLTRRAALRRPKGAGKSPEGGYCSYAELVLPVVFSHWANGQPVGQLHPDPWVQLAAVSEDQTDNVSVWLYDILADRPKVVARRHIDLGRSRIYLKDRSGRMEPVTAAAGSREGQRVTFAVLDQSEAWSKENGGVRLASTLRRNVGKMGGWSLELQNAPGLGDGSVADQTGKASDRRAKGIYFDSREPPAGRDLDLGDSGVLRPALAFAYGDSVAHEPCVIHKPPCDAHDWGVNLDRLVDEVQDPDTDPSDARKYYLNVSSPSSDWAFDRERWQSLGGEGLVPEDGELIVAGFDGARHDDSTAIVGVGVESGNAWLIGVWERPDRVDEWEVPELDVNATVAEMFDRWQVWRFYCDPPFWETTVASWEARFKSTDRSSDAVVPWWTNQWRRIGHACRALGTAIRSGEIHHQTDADDVLSVHVRNAVRRNVNSRDEKGRPLWTLEKPAEGRKIDAAMALVLGWEARSDAIAAGASKARKYKVASF